VRKARSTPAPRSRKPAPQAIAAPSYLDQLQAKLDESEALRDRTRARILSAAARALATEGYHEALVRRICDDLGLSRGAFYKYFENRTDVVAEVLTGFCDFVYRASIGIGHGKSDFERIYEVTYFYCQLYIVNKGLFAVQYNLARQKSAYSDGWHQLQDKWRGRLARYILRATGVEAAGYRDALLLAYMLTSLANDLLYRLIFEREQELLWLEGQARETAAMISIVWYRAIFCRDPVIPRQLKARIGFRGALPSVRDLRPV